MDDADSNRLRVPRVLFGRSAAVRKAVRPLCAAALRDGAWPFGIGPTAWIDVAEVRLITNASRPLVPVDTLCVNTLTRELQSQVLDLRLGSTGGEGERREHQLSTAFLGWADQFWFCLSLLADEPVLRLLDYPSTPRTASFVRQLLPKMMVWFDDIGRIQTKFTTGFTGRESWFGFYGRLLYLTGMSRAQRDVIDAAQADEAKARIEVWLAGLQVDVGPER